MMISLEPEIEDLKDKTVGESAILKINSVAASGFVKRRSCDTDFFSNNSSSVESSVFMSPSVNSFSTLPEQEVFNNFEQVSKDLQVTVDNPQKHLETLETFITFRITTRSSRPEYDVGEYVVRRRYNDFLWLRQKLMEAYPTHIIPPMPGKHTLLAQLDRYSKEFIVARMRLLNSFLNRVINHPILSCDKSLHIFLTAKPAEFSIHRKNRSNVLVKMTDSLQSITCVHTIKQRHLEFEQVRDYCMFLSEKLSTIDKISHRVQRERQDYLVELHQLHPIFTQWASLETELAPILLGIAKAIESNAISHQRLLDSVSNDEQEYLAYIDAVKDALARRDSMQIEYEMIVEELRKKRLDKDQLMNVTNGSALALGWSSSLWKGESRDEKLEKLGQTIPRLAKRAELLQDRLECANENLRSDLQRWNVERRADLKAMLIAMANQQIVHYRNCMNAWEQVRVDLKLDEVDSDIATNTFANVPV